MSSIPTPRWMKQLFGQSAEARVLENLDQVVERRWLEIPGANAKLPPVAATHEVVLRDRAGYRLSGEVYVPKGIPPFPVLLYLHGGGWCHGSAASVRRLARRLAEPGFLVLNLSYGLAPEHPYPHAVEDTVYACRWLVREGAGYGGDSSRIAVAGDSAGANLAAAAIVHLRGGGGDALDEGDLAGTEVAFSAAALFYGVFDFPLLVSEPATPSGTVEVMFNQAYLGSNFLTRHREPLVSPILASDLGVFPPCYLACGAEDYLLPQSLAMTSALARAGVPTTLSVVEHANHVFLQLEDHVPSARKELESVLAWLLKHHGTLGGSARPGS